MKPKIDPKLFRLYIKKLNTEEPYWHSGRLQSDKWLEPKILVVADENGWTIAHDLAHTGCLCKYDLDEAILRLATVKRIDNIVAEIPKGHTVAHVLAEKCKFWLPKNPKVLNLTDEDGVSVADILARKLFKDSAKLSTLLNSALG